MGVKSMDIIIKKIANYLPVPQRMISFAVLKERDSGSPLTVVLPAGCM